MKTSCRGVSAVNIHLNELAGIAKNHFILKLFSILFMLIGVQLAYADKLSFYFLYGDVAIESVFFDHIPGVYNPNASYETTAKNGDLSVSTSSRDASYIVTVTNKTNHEGADQVAIHFNRNMQWDMNHMIELTATMANPSTYLDFWVRGTLYINGEPVASDFTLAHDLYSPNNWWIATLAGSKYIITQAMNVHSASGKLYCLHQNSTNYQVIVTSGECVPTYAGITPIVNDNESTTWQYVGNINFARAYGDHYSMAADDNGHPVVAYADYNTSHTTVMEFNGYYSGSGLSGWRILDTTNPNYQQPNPYISDYTGYFPSIKIYNGSPTVAYQDFGPYSVNGGYSNYAPVGVKTFNQQRGWSYLGNKFYLNDKSNYTGEITLGNDPSTNSLYVAFAVGNPQYCAKLYTIKYNGVSNWALYGSQITDSINCTLNAPYFSSMGLSLDFTNGIPQVSFNKVKSNRGPINPAEVASYNSSKGNWDILEATSDDTSYVNTAADSLGNSYVVYQNPAKQQIIMTKFAASAPGLHIDVAAISENSNTGAYNNLVIDRYSDSPFYNQPILAFVDSSNQNRVTVLRFDGSVWHYIGKPGLPYVADLQYTNPKIVISHHSILVSFQDKNGSISVMEYPKN